RLVHADPELFRDRAATGAGGDQLGEALLVDLDRRRAATLRLRFLLRLRLRDDWLLDALLLDLGLVHGLLVRLNRLGAGTADQVPQVDAGAEHGRRDRRHGNHDVP